MIDIKRKGNSEDIPYDGDICFETDTCKYSIYYKGKYYPVPEEAIELSNLIKDKPKRKIQYYSDKNLVWNYYLSEERCSCGCNVYHYEYDGTEIYGVCNACNKDIYLVKNENVNETLNTGIWR